MFTSTISRVAKISDSVQYIGYYLGQSHGLDRGSRAYVKPLLAAGAIITISEFIALNKRLPLVTEIFLLLFSLSIAAVWLGLEFRLRFVQLPLPASQIRPELGRAYLTKIPRPSLRDFVRLETDSPRTPEASFLELYEDGRRLGPRHSPPDHIRTVGQGAFSHWGRELYFSTSDGSSPFTNGRTYLVRSPLTPTPLSRRLGVIAFLVILWRLVVLLPPAPRRSVVTIFRRTFRWLVMPRQFGGHWIISASIALAVVGASWYYLMDVWGSAKTIQFGVGGFFQVSDASGYAMCANQVLDRSSGVGIADYFGGWCLHRPIYATFLATILGLTGRSWLWTMLIQCSLVGLSIAVLLRATSRLAGPITAIIVLLVMFAFSAENVYPSTTTESAGLALGAVGLAFLLDATRLGDRSLLFLGVVCLSVALNARAGAFFALPFLAMGVFFQSAPWRSRLSSTAIVVAGIASGFATQYFLIAHFGGTSGASNSNFSYTLYGLSVGGKGWGQVFTDHPEIFHNRSEAQFARLIFDLAWTNMVSSPLLITKALATNLLHYLHDPLLGISGLRILWWLGALAIALRWRELPYRVIGLMSVGILLSSPVVIQDGGPRIFAATWGVTALQVGLGPHLILSWLWRVFYHSSSSTGFRRMHPHLVEVGLAVFLLAAIFLPLTPLRGLVSLSPVPARGCMNGEKELIARLGHESYMIVLVEDGQPKSHWQMQVSANDLRRGLKGAWFEKGFVELPVPATVVHGYQVMATQGRSGVGDDIRLVWHGDLGRLSGKTVSFCFRPDVTVPVTDATYYLVRTVRPLEP